MARLTLGGSAGLTEALRVAENGWPVFPLTPGEKVPVRGSRGFLDATTDPEMIMAAFTLAGAGAGVGVRCTGAAGFTVDCDVKKGKDGIRQFLSGWPVGQSRKTVTPSGGMHFTYATPDGFVVPTGQDVLGPGVDIRGPGGYRVHFLDDGKGLNTYTHPFSELTLGPAPDELLTALKQVRDRQTGPLRAEGTSFDSMDPGQEMCPAVLAAMEKWVETGNHEEHHNTASLLMQLFYLNAEGHLGVKQAINTGRGVYALGREAKSKRDGVLREPGDVDYDRMVAGSARRAPRRTIDNDPCSWRPR